MHASPPAVIFPMTFVTQDLITIGRVLHIPTCTSPDAKQFEADVQRQVRAAQASDKATETSSAKTSVLESLSREVIARFNGRIIRRGLQSQMPDGSCIVSLPPLHWVKVPLRVLAHDRPLLSQLIKEEEKRHRTLTFVSTKVCSDHQVPTYLISHTYQNFYVLLRQGTGQPEHVVSAELSRKAISVPPYADMNDFFHRASTKTQTTVDIMKWHYRGDSTTGSFPLGKIQAERDTEPIEPGRPFKAVIYTAFPWLMAPLQQVSILFVPQPAAPQ
jgi:hypothetical protein